MEVILLERIEKLGGLGDIVSVKNGFARNYLLPQKKALRATDSNKALFEKEREALEAKNAELKKTAESSAEKIDGLNLVIIRQAGDTGQLYGSVSTRDIAEAASSDEVTLKRNQIVLEKPIKLLGLHPVRISLHPEVAVSVTVNVARTEEEAERQAAGEDVTKTQDDADEEAISVDEVFEDEAAAQQASEDLTDAPEEEGAEEVTEEVAETRAEEGAEEAGEDAGEEKDA